MQPLYNSVEMANRILALLNDLGKRKIIAATAETIHKKVTIHMENGG